MLSQGGGRDEKTCLRVEAEQCWRIGADCCDVRSGNPEKPAESAAREVSLTPDQMAKLTVVMSAMTKSQKEAQEMSDSVTKLAEEIKQLRISRAREETVRAKAACVGGAMRNIKSLSEKN